MSGTERIEKRGRYNFTEIEAKWQRYWQEHETFKVLNPSDCGADTSKPKYYVLDMFPYPSGAGLHVGHPLGYCATDIICRYKRMRGFNVLHPMGFDAFGLPAEQYAIEHNVHPADTTRANIETYRRQLKMFGFSYDWSREVATCEPDYYKHTQWIFLQMFKSWYDDQLEWTDPQGNQTIGRATPIEELVAQFKSGAWGVDADLELVRDKETPRREWVDLSKAERRQAVNNQRLAFIDEVAVNWCPALGTVLANEEVTNDGRSERGNHPVYRRPLRQWMLRITRYGDRLLNDLDDLDWPEPIKLMQRNWVGRSTGAEVIFPLAKDWAVEGGEWKCLCGSCADQPVFSDFPRSIKVYTTRPDTLFGATYMVLAPEHPLVGEIITDERKGEVETYVAQARNKSELDRTADTKEKTGVFTGAYAINPVNGKEIPIWIADYVLMGYGTGAIMAVPGHDTRDCEFAKAFDLRIIPVVMPTDEWLAQEEIRPADLQDVDVLSEASMRDLRDAYRKSPESFVEVFVDQGVAINSQQFDGMSTAECKTKITKWLESRCVGRTAVNYKLREWIFSRQKYWGEPFPVLHGEDGETIGLDESELPVELPPMDNFKPTPVEGDSDSVPEPPLGRAKAWATVERDGKDWRRDLNTMPQWAGSCWYYLRFIDPHNSDIFCASEAERYWMPIDLYVGGAEHAVLHLLYARFWHKVLFDLGHVSTREPFQRLFNQGMIQSFAARTSRGTVVAPKQLGLQEADGSITPLTDDQCMHFVNDDLPEEDVKRLVEQEGGEPVARVVAKMSKSLKNVVNPDSIIAEYGADTFRMYEMYMGPLDAAKPWNTQDVPGLFRLNQRIWRLVVDEFTGENSVDLVDVEPSDEALRLLHGTIKRVTEELEQLKLNTAIAALFDFVNGMTKLGKRPRKVIEPFVLLVSPFAPHLAEELWARLGHGKTLAYEPWPVHDETLAKDDEVEVAVQIMGKVKARITVHVDADEKTLEKVAMADAKIQSLLQGKTVRKVIVVKGRLVNIVAN